MDLAFRAIQAPMQTRVPARMRANGGKSGRRPPVSNSAPQSTSATSNTQLVVLRMTDPVTPYYQRALSRAAAISKTYTPRNASDQNKHNTQITMTENSGDNS